VFRFTVDQGDLNRIEAFINGALMAESDPDPVVTMLKVYGMYTTRQFQTRGLEFGSKWQSISEYTRKVRQQRGQNALAPPLSGTGWLAKTVGRRIEEWPVTLMSRPFTDYGMTTDPPSDGPTTLTVNILPHQAVMHMSGPKAAHMTGDTSRTFAAIDMLGGYAGGRYGYGYLPPRPFWGFSAGMAEALPEAAAAGFIRAWADLAQKHGSGRVNYSTPSMAYMRMFA